MIGAEGGDWRNGGRGRRTAGDGVGDGGGRIMRARRKEDSEVTGSQSVPES